PIRRQLDIYWPDLHRPPFNERFWRYEYNKHGYCSSNIYNSSDYFKKALTLRQDPSLDILRILTAAGLGPGASHRYVDIETAIKKRIGKKPALRCKKLWGYHGTLSEITLCYDYYGQQLIDCPQSAINCAATNVMFPR
ncbi:Ribonuclease_T2 domain-containing protein, partial [Cephalotus follicularis]